MKYLIFRADIQGAESYIARAEDFEDAKMMAHAYIENVEKDNIPSHMEIMNLKNGAIFLFNVERIVTTRLVDA